MTNIAAKNRAGSEILEKFVQRMENLALQTKESVNDLNKLLDSFEHSFFDADLEGLIWNSSERQSQIKSLQRIFAAC